jgi:hypothetical protein
VSLKCRNVVQIFALNAFLLLSATSDVYNVSMTMIRKQLYLESHQDAALKRKARALGLSEAELVRRALDAALQEPTQSSISQHSTLHAVLEDAKALSLTHAPASGYLYSREDAYRDEPRLER